MLASAVARPSLGSVLAPHYADVLAPSASPNSRRAAWPSPETPPIVYCEDYNISLYGIEKLHPFDASKFRRVADGLEKAGVAPPRGRLVAPLAATEALLLDVHDAAYLEKLRSSPRKVAEVMELAPLAALPRGALEKRVLAPMRAHAAGTVLAAALAVERGWAVNLGGGMHHAWHADGGGWCPYDDIMLAVRRLRRASGGAVRRVLVVDLDAHQGNGLGRDKLKHQDSDLLILDAYNKDAYPRDDDAKPAIDVAVELQAGAGDEEYLSRLDDALARAAAICGGGRAGGGRAGGGGGGGGGDGGGGVDLVIFNAGTDILDGDPLGRLAVTAAGVAERDARVWRFAIETLRAPVAMLLSGGYTKRSAGAIVDSLAALLARHAGLGGGGGR